MRFDDCTHEPNETPSKREKFVVISVPENGGDGSPSRPKRAFHDTARPAVAPYQFLVVGAMIASPPSLVGTWRLVSFEARDSKGQLQYPLGEHVSGLLMYDAGGNMSAHIMRNDRPLFAAADPDRGTDAEVRAAFDGYASYFGTYTIDHAMQTVTHHVRGAWYPNWIGNDQLRHFKFDGSRLVLSTPPLVSDGKALEYVAIWERIS